MVHLTLQPFHSHICWKEGQVGPNCLANLILVCISPVSHDSSVGIVLGYGLDDWGSRIRFLVGAGNFSLHHHIQNSSGTYPASYPMGTRGCFPAGKVARV
jgi:hypothetical protein